MNRPLQWRMVLFMGSGGVTGVEREVDWQQATGPCGPMSGRLPTILLLASCGH